MKSLKRLQILIADAMFLVSILAAGLLTVRQPDLAASARLLAGLLGVVIVMGW